jgi:hypothetical protein
MEHTHQSLSKEQIQELALEVYPITPFYDGDECVDIDTNQDDRIAFMEGLNKASSMLYNKEQLRQAFDAGIFSSVDGKHFGHFMESLKEEV